MGTDADPTVSTKSARACATDHLVALARVFHPHRDPRYVWELRRWVWVPPWQPPATADHDAEVLGKTWEEASRSLQRQTARLRCPHGRAMVHRCEGCRVGVLNQLNPPKQGASQQ